jgi:hypothetical protein
VLLKSSVQNERNAFSFGWHIGYYAFVLTTASKGTGRKLDEKTKQIISIIRPRCIELFKYFKVDAEFKEPTSPQEAKQLRAYSGRV